VGALGRPWVESRRPNSLCCEYIASERLSTCVLYPDRSSPRPNGHALPFSFRFHALLFLLRSIEPVRLGRPWVESRRPNSLCCEYIASERLSTCVLYRQLSRSSPRPNGHALPFSFRFHALLFLLRSIEPVRLCFRSMLLRRKSRAWKRKEKGRAWPFGLGELRSGSSTDPCAYASALDATPNSPLPLSSSTSST
jgi:hypothetical protein